MRWLYVMLALGLVADQVLAQNGCGGGASAYGYSNGNGRAYYGNGNGNGYGSYSAPGQFAAPAGWGRPPRSVEWRSADGARMVLTRFEPAGHYAPPPRYVEYSAPRQFAGYHRPPAPARYSAPPRERRIGIELSAFRRSNCPTCP